MKTNCAAATFYSEDLMYQSISLEAVLGWIGLLALALGLNELCRRSKWLSLLMFLVIPGILTFTVWPRTAGPGTTMNTWFYWVKTYSVMAGCLGFLAIRFIPRLAKNKFALCFPALIFAVNIAEAVLRDFQVYGMHLNGQLLEGMATRSGPWNIMNGIAGILNILTISGWLGIFITKDKTRDMIWPDMLWFWVIAYDLWNLAYGYNCVGDQSFYSGFCILAAATIPELMWRKGAYLQHRAQTLATWMVLCMSMSYVFDHSHFAVKGSLNYAPLFVLSFLALAWNVAVFVYHFAKVFKHKRNIARGVHFDLGEYKELVAERDQASDVRLDEPAAPSRGARLVAPLILLFLMVAIPARAQETTVSSLPQLQSQSDHAQLPAPGEQATTFGDFTFSAPDADKPLAASAAPVAQQPAAGMSGQDLAKEISNPVTSLWQLQFQFNNVKLETGNSSPTDGKWVNNLYFQPVMPISLTDKLNLITRPVFTLYNSVPTPTGDRQTTLGDTTLATVFSPAGTEPWIFGIGPTWIFPTAPRSDFTGQGKWQVGPAVGGGYITKDFMIAGFAQQWWSFAGDHDRQNTSQMNLMPLIYRFWGDGWSAGYSGNILADWYASSRNRWTVPLGPSIGKVIMVGKLPVQVQVAAQYYVVRPRGGPEWNFQLQITPVIPKLFTGTLFK